MSSATKEKQSRSSLLADQRRGAVRLCVLLRLVRGERRLGCPFGETLSRLVQMRLFYWEVGYMDGCRVGADVERLSLHEFGQREINQAYQTRRCPMCSQWMPPYTGLMNLVTDWRL